MQRVKGFTERETEQSKQRLFPLFSKVNTRVYAMSAVTKLKDLGVATLKLKPNKGLVDHIAINHEISQLGKQIKVLPETLRETAVTQSFEQISIKHKVGLFFAYPVMKPIATNQRHLEQNRLAIKRIDKKLKLRKDELEAKYSKTKLTFRNIYNDKKYKLIEKYMKEIEFYEKENENRMEMIKLFKKITVPNTLKGFMAEINKLTINDKNTLEGLLSKKSQLLFRRDLVAASYELMFAYDATCNDFIIGLRSLYDHNHPHPTVIGGDDPEVMVAGTIDLRLEGETLRVVKIRIDSGHYKPDAQSFEVIMRYVRCEMNPKYYDQVILQTIEDDSSAPQVTIRK